MNNSMLEASTAQPLPHALSMSSREIAELTGKRHDNVLRDIRVMLEELGETSPQIWSAAPDSYGRQQKVARLSKALTLTLLCGYSVVLRARIVNRWMELEAAQSKPSSSGVSFREALLLAAELAAQDGDEGAVMEQAFPSILCNHTPFSHP